MIPEDVQFIFAVIFLFFFIIFVIGPLLAVYWTRQRETDDFVKELEEWTQVVPDWITGDELDETQADYCSLCGINISVLGDCNCTKEGDEEE